MSTKPTGLPDDRRRSIPSVDHIMSGPELKQAAARYGHNMTVEAVREELARVRERVARGEQCPTGEQVAGAAVARLERLNRGTLYPVINATGVVVHTNLGRAPLSQDAREAIDAITKGYSNLEFDMAAGERGSRYDHVEKLLCRLTGAEAALVVNNNAGAVFLTLLALAQAREVVISRGQLVEIGGGFRIPDVLRQSGARLVEVGTTNRTHLYDYRAAITADTALLLRVHSSNFKQVGFTADVSLKEMVELGREMGILVVDDLGSGTLLDTTKYGLSAEPMVQQSVAAGADVVTFSGDKLLGGPQAGMIVGRKETVDRMRYHPLARALRVDKATLAGLQATLLHYLREEAESAIPVWRMISASPDELAARVASWAAVLRSQKIPATVIPAYSTVGGGSLPGDSLPTQVLALKHPAPDTLAAALRSGDPPVVARISDNQLILDPRTVLPETDQLLLQALAQAWATDAALAGAVA